MQSGARANATAQADEFLGRRELVVKAASPVVAKSKKPPFTCLAWRRTGDGAGGYVADFGGDGAGMGAQWTAVGTTTLKEQAGDQEKLIDQQGDLLQIQSRQLEVQQQQLDDQRELNAGQAGLMDLQAQELRESLDDGKREAAERRRAQAARVFLWADPAGGDPNVTWVMAVRMTNTSAEPIYNPVIYWYRGVATDGSPDLLDTIMPGGDDFADHQFPHGTNMEAVGAVLRFRDAAGTRWRRRLDGDLTEVEN